MIGYLLGVFSGVVYGELPIDADALDDVDASVLTGDDRADGRLDEVRERMRPRVRGPLLVWLDVEAEGFTVLSWS